MVKFRLKGNKGVINLVFIKKHKNKIIIFLLLTVGLVLILFGNMKSKKNNTSLNNEFSCEQYTKELEEKIELFLLNVEGIKDVKVIVTLNSSGEQIYAEKSNSYGFLSSKSSEEPSYTSEIYPDVRGIAIACTNGSNDEFKIKITRLISAYLGISSNRIEIVNFG